ncbi:MAG: peptidylprolyl isomerase [Rhodobacteraceae bacterium]|nr:peptidylprolyl isomerase [Paracoccaceae bacterium]MCW9043208.1 peptidylprolyl isomerase [Pseudopelagicola sp.]
MSKHVNFMRNAALTLFLAVPAIANAEPTSQTVIATVNDTEITLGHMVVVRENLPEQYKTLPDDVLFKGILDQIIQQTLLAQSLNGPEPETVKIALENQKRLLLAEAAINAALEEGVDVDALQKLYQDKYVVNYQGTSEFNASHILVETQEEAEAIRAEILAGADFAEIAKEKSTGPSGPSGGVLGWFGPGEMVPPFEEAVTKLSVGDLSDPVQTQFGWHVVKLNDMRIQEAPSFEEVQTELASEIQEKIIDAKVAALTENATIDNTASADIDPAILKNLSLVGNPSGE